MAVERFSLEHAAAVHEQLYQAACAAARPSAARLAGDALRSGAGLFTYKVHRKFQRWRGTAPTEDFNTVGTILRGATGRAGPGRRCPVNSIPLVDLAAQHAGRGGGGRGRAGRRCSARTAFVGGPQVGAFEREYAEFSGARHCIGVANGTDAIEIALRALGIGPGDECILPANSFMATAEAVARAGATPVLVDCADDGSYLIDADAVEAAVTPRTRAIIPVHLYGQAAPAERLAPVAGRFGGWVVADAAQAQGARRNGARRRAPSPTPRPRASTRARTSAPTATRGRC